MLSILQLIESPGEVKGGSAIYCDQDQCTDLLSLSEKQIASYRGNKIGMIYQQALAAFNPVQKIGRQLTEAIKTHNAKSAENKNHLRNLLSKVEIKNPDRVIDSYSHQLSGGQLQRCMIAMAIINSPNILIADEPTTGLDVITQKSVLQLLHSLKSKLNMSMIFISHDLGVIAEMADSVVVMKDGVIVERGKTLDIFANPKSNYTKALLLARPNITSKSKRLPTFDDLENDVDINSDLFKPIELQSILERQKVLLNNSNLLEVRDLSKSYVVEKGLFGKPSSQVQAVKNINLDLKCGEVLGIVGESGSGKSTLASLILNLESADKGSVSFKGQNIFLLDKKEMRTLRKDIQIIFQDVGGALDPKMKTSSSIDIALRIHYPSMDKKQRRDKIISLLKQVGLTEKHVDRYPHELSGGERQRVCIARAISLQPQLLVCDECVSALDVSVQAQILNLLLDLRDDLDLSMIFISHDLSVINFMCDRILIMKSGKIVEQGYPQDILQNPQEEYTRKLLAAIPSF